LTPLAIKLGLPDVSKTGRVAGLIFALSTLGCLIGNYLTGFVLIPAFTINTLVLVAAASLAVLSAAALLLLKDPESAVNGVTPAYSSAGENRVSAPNPHAFSDIHTAYAIVFLSSFGGMTLELTASRVLAPYVGVSLFTWTGIIGVMLAGTALGNFIGGLFADRAAQPDGMRRPLAWLAAIVVAVLAFGVIYRVLPWAGGIVGMPFALTDQSWLILGIVGSLLGGFGIHQLLVRSVGETVNPRALLATTLLSAGAGIVLLQVVRVFLYRTDPFDQLDPIAQVMGWTFSLFFLPMFALGMVSPQVIRLAVPDVEHVGRVAGRVYAWSTAGAIAGTFAAGYVLLSARFLGADRTLFGVALIVTLTSLAVAKVWETSLLLYLFAIVLGGVTGGFILTALSVSSDEVIAKRETNYYTIRVGWEWVGGVDQEGRGVYFRTGRKTLTLDHLLHSIVDPSNPRYLHYEHEHIQMEFLWAARAGAAQPRALVIGGGGYTFPRFALTALPETRMDVVEIDPGVTEVAYQYLGLEPYDGLNIVHMDGRQFVAEKAAAGDYDLVVQDAVNDLSVPAHLLTKEYNDAVKRSLKPDGVYLLTVIDSIKFGRLWRSAVRTLRASFAHVELVSFIEVPPPTAPANATENELNLWQWRLRNFEEYRHVLVIYAADRPLDEERIRAEGFKRRGYESNVPAAAIAGEPAVEVMRPILDKHFYTHTVPAAQLAPFLEADPGVFLTDQYAPVDNLMAEVFRYRYRKRPEEKRQE
jgi:spermine/spermidine synthase